MMCSACQYLDGDHASDCKSKGAKVSSLLKKLVNDIAEGRYGSKNKTELMMKLWEIQSRL